MNPATPNPRDGWEPLPPEPLPPEPLPRPTHFAAFLAMGTTLFFWGLISSWMTLVMGLSLFAFALGGWINEIRHERKTH